MKLLVLTSLISSLIGYSISGTCIRKPVGSTTQNTPADGRFQLLFEDKGHDEKLWYTPDQFYSVTLRTTDKMGAKDGFNIFLISLEPQVEPDPKNPRKPKYLEPGSLIVLNDDTNVKYSGRCPGWIEQSNHQKKDKVQVRWKSPSYGNGCVTIHAMVAENEEVWYVDDGPLSLHICEDRTEAADMEPTPVKNCEVCEDAKYELKFEGIWSRNTHPKGYPANEYATRFSDLIGASHSFGYSIWDYNKQASRGVVDLVTTGKTESLEQEIKGNLTKVRTVIKGKGHSHPHKNEPIYITFRADRINHQVSLITAIIPSPDWFLGVSRLELCTEEASWLQSRELNLYPADAGCDNGNTYEASNEGTYPPEAIKRIRAGMSNDPQSPFTNLTQTQMKPFAKLYVTLIRTYPVECSNSSDSEPSEPNENESETNDNENSPEEPEPPKRITSPMPPNNELENEGSSEVIPDEEENSNCPLSPWSEWGDCMGSCNYGTQMRRRFHVVDGEIIDYNYKGPKKESPECAEQYPNDAFYEIQQCPGQCETDTIPQSSFGYLRNDDKSQTPGRNNGIETNKESRQNDAQTQDCVFSDWSEWTPCNCQTKTKSRSRYILRYPKPPARRQCSKKLTAFRKCAQGDCN